MQKVKINLITLPKEVVLEIDLLRLQQVVINLLSNALKFSKASDVIEVKLQMTAVGFDGEVELKIDVKDKGIGIAAHEQELIFEPFYRSPNTNSYGHGIGLSICRRIMEKLRGTISVESRLGCGSTFTIWFNTKRYDISNSKTLTVRYFYFYDLDEWLQINTASP
jgi:signal transduction histidine kinase